MDHNIIALPNRKRIKLVTCGLVAWAHKFNPYANEWPEGVNIDDDGVCCLVRKNEDGTVISREIIRPGMYVVNLPGGRQLAMEPDEILKLFGVPT